MVSRYGKVYNLGHRVTEGILDRALYVEEKVDGSQFGFGVRDGQLYCRSKRANLDLEAPQKLFRGAVATAQRLFDEGLLVEGFEYRGEAIESPRHNVITYGRTPIGHIVLFDVDIGEQAFSTRQGVEDVAARLGLEVPPLLFGGSVKLTEEILDRLLDTESFLGGGKVEGVVLKPVDEDNTFYAPDGKRIVAKVVSAAFREKAKVAWPSKNRNSLMDGIAERYGTEARWLKAIQRLEEEGKLTNSPRDIGALIKEIHKDIVEEERAEIMDILFDHHFKGIRSAVIRGFPEWYKDRCTRAAFDE